MTEWRELTRDERVAALQQVAGLRHIPPQAVEKDLWVTVILQVVFSLPFAEHLVFKGGTSLSKVFGKIERFSEDIDLAIDRTYFGLEGDLTKKQLKKLRKVSSTFVRDEFSGALKEALQRYGMDGLSVAAEPDGEGDATYPEPRKVYIEYESLFKDAIGYIRPRVMLEIGARSLIEPTMEATVRSLIEEGFPDVRTAVVNPLISTAVIEKTFLEKAFLLYELFTTGAGVHANRKSRHLYDLERMMDEPFAAEAIRNDDLWEAISHHRQVFTSMRDVDYTPDIRRRIVLVPPKDFLKEWEEDYEAMRGTMVFGTSLEFKALIERMKELEGRFRKGNNGNMDAPDHSVNP